MFLVYLYHTETTYLGVTVTKRIEYSPQFLINSFKNHTEQILHLFRSYMTSFRFPFHADTRLKYKHYYQIVELKGLFGKHLAKTLAHLVSQLLPHRYLDTCSVNMWQQSRTAQFSPISGHVLPKQNSKEKISEWYDDMMKY